VVTLCVLCNNCVTKLHKDNAHKATQRNFL